MSDTISELGDAFGVVEEKATTKGSERERDRSDRSDKRDVRDGKLARGSYGKTASDEKQPKAPAAGDPEDDEPQPDEDDDDKKKKGARDPDDEDDDADHDDADDADEDEDDDEDEKKKAARGQFELKVNGETRTLTLEQMKEAASKGLSAHERWEKAASTQKKADELVTRLNGERQQVATMLQNVQTHLRVLMQSETPNLDELAMTDPAAWVRQKHLLEQRQQHLRDAEAATAYLARQQAQQAADQHGQFLELQKERVLDAIPEWNDGEKARAAITRINGLLADAGFSNDEIAGVADSRIVRILHAASVNAEKAAKYDALKAKTKANEKRVQNLPPANVEPPGTRQPKSSQRAEQRRRDVKQWEKNPNLDNLARLF